MQRAKLVPALVVMGAAVIVAGLTPASLAKTKLTWYVTGNSWKFLADKFMKEHPNVQVTMISGEMDKFYAMTTAGLMPDIWGPWGTPGIHADVNRNWATDLTPYIQRDGKAIDTADFFPGVMREFRINGKQYSLPIFSYVDYYFYNPDLYAQSGVNTPPVDSSDHSWNWDRMVSELKKIARLDSTGKRLTVTGLDFMRDTHSPSYQHMWGASPYSKQAIASSVPQEIHYDTPEMKLALQSMWDLIYKYQVSSPGNVGLTGGKLAASIGPGWDIGGYMKLKKPKWKIANLPWAKTDQGTMWPDGWRISRVCKNKDMAWTFVKFLCSPESMKFIVTNPKDTYSGTPVARKSVFNETLGANISEVTGMSPEDVFRVTEQSDAVDIVKYQETICLDRDMAPFVDPIFGQLWANKLSPAQASASLQKMADQRLPDMFKRWLRNIKFTGAE